MKKILLVEDDHTLRENISIILSEEYSVVDVEDGSKAIEILNEVSDFDLILSDIMMPKVDGYKLYDHVKDSNLLSEIPFVFLTAKADHKAIRKGMELGADDYIPKPFSIDELLIGVKTRISKTEKSKKKIEDLKNSISLYIPHELRTPLVSILGNSDFISSYFDDLSKNEIIDMTNSIYKSGLRLKRIILKFLKYSDLTVQKTNNFKESKNDSLFFSNRHNCKSVLESCYECLDRFEDISFNFKDCEIRISQEDFEGILIELVSNACKFSEKGSPIVVVGDIINDEYIVSITDSGKGISKENINTIGLFTQFDRDYYQQGGNGIGLAIVKLFCEKYDIDFSIESEVDKFTTVTLKFKLVIPSTTD
jgi:CheY-like chemotaxis protein